MPIDLEEIEKSLSEHYHYSYSKRHIHDLLQVVRDRTNILKLIIGQIYLANDKENTKDDLGRYLYQLNMLTKQALDLVEDSDEG